MEPPFYSLDLITMKKKFFAKYSSDYEPHSSSHNPPHHHTIIIGAMPFKKSFWNNSQQQPAWCAKEKWKKMRTRRELSFQQQQQRQAPWCCSGPRFCNYIGM